MSKKDNIALLLNPTTFWDERPAMTAYTQEEVQEGINTAFNLINAECGNLPYKVLEYNAPHLENPETIMPDNDLKRTDYELDQFKQAIVTQTQYTLNIGNDYAQGSSTFSTGGMSATVQRPENRDIFAPGVKMFLQNARLYQLQVYTSSSFGCKAASQEDCDLGLKFITIDKGDTRYVHQYQENATPGQVAFINNNKQVSFANPSELSFNVLRAKEVLDRDGTYRQIKDVRNLAFFGEQGTDAMKRTEIIDTIKAYKQFDPNFRYMNEDIVWTWNESTRFVDYWKSKQDDNIGHPPQLDANFAWWEKIFNRDIRAKYIYDPVDNVYKMINQFDVNYFGGMTRDEIYSAINASGTTWNENTNYKKGFVVIFVDSTNALEWYENLQDNNQGHNPETSPEWWKKLPTPAIDVNDVINQIKPYIQEIVEQDVDKKLDTLKTAITTDYAGSEYYFTDEQAFETFLANNPKLQREWFDDVPNIDLSGYAKLNVDNSFSGNQSLQLNNLIRWKKANQTDDAGVITSNDGSLWFEHSGGSGNAVFNVSSLNFNTQVPINNVANPTQPQQVATKSYVDTQLGQYAGLEYANTFTGYNIFELQIEARQGIKTLSGTSSVIYGADLPLAKCGTKPTEANHVVNKAYADSLTIKQKTISTDNLVVRDRFEWTYLNFRRYSYNYGEGINNIVSIYPAEASTTEFTFSYCIYNNGWIDFVFTQFGHNFTQDIYSQIVIKYV